MRRRWGLLLALACLLGVGLALRVQVGAWALRRAGRAGLSAPCAARGLAVCAGAGLRLGSSTALRFKVSEADETSVEEDEELDFGQGGESGGKSLLRKLSRGVVPLAASLGFVVTPSSAVAVRVAGAAVGGVAGVLARRAILSNLAAQPDNTDGGGDDSDLGGSSGPTAPSVKTALALLASGGPPASSLDLLQLEAVAKKAGVAADDLAEFFTFAFADVVSRAVSEEGADLTDLSDVIDFAERAQLTQSEVGDGFSLAAVRIGLELERDARGFFVEDFPADALQRASKIFFLADKIMGLAGASEGYYGKRLATSLSYFTRESFQSVITEACTELYQRCVRSVVASPQAFSEEEVQTLKAFLTTSAGVSTLRPAGMQAFVAQALQGQLDQALGDATAAAAAAAAAGTGEAGAAVGRGQGAACMTARLDNYDGLRQVRFGRFCFRLFLPFSVRHSLTVADIPTPPPPHTHTHTHTLAHAGAANPRLVAHRVHEHRRDAHRARVRGRGPPDCRLGVRAARPNRGPHCRSSGPRDGAEDGHSPRARCHHRGHQCQELSVHEQD